MAGLGLSLSFPGGCFFGGIGGGRDEASSDMKLMIYTKGKKLNDGDGLEWSERGGGGDGICEMSADHPLFACRFQ